MHAHAPVPSRLGAPRALLLARPRAQASTRLVQPQPRRVCLRNRTLTQPPTSISDARFDRPSCGQDYAALSDYSQSQLFAENLPPRHGMGHYFDAASLKKTTRGYPASLRNTGHIQTLTIRGF